VLAGEQLPYFDENKLAEEEKYDGFYLFKLSKSGYYTLKLKKSIIRWGKSLIDRISFITNLFS
jgi:hypothetical protein